METKMIISSAVFGFVLLIANSDDSYTKCIKTIVDGHLKSKKNQIKNYKFSALPKKKGFGGKVIYKSGAIILIEEKEESSALMLFSQQIADYTSGLNWVNLRKELQGKCKHGS